MWSNSDEYQAVAEVMSPARSLTELAGRFRALVLLAGSVRPSELGRAINRSLLDLPLEPGRSVLSVWQAHTESLAVAAGLASLPIRVAIDRAAPAAAAGPASRSAPIQVERDPAEFRGTGGILHDLARSYQADDLMLVANAAQVLVEPLPDLASSLVEAHAAGAAVSVIGHRDGTPGGLFLVRCSVLRSAPEVGFLDFKEQFLPRLAAAGQDIRVIQRPSATGLPVRNLDGYIAALKVYHRLSSAGAAISDPFAEDWSPTFAVCEAGAAVDRSATIHDSVVLSGGRVERGAVVVRCVVAPGGVVSAGETIADRVVGGRERIAGRLRR
jgi:hypothetical protein